MFGLKNYQWKQHPLLYEHVELGLKMIYDDFENRTCENCKYSKQTIDFSQLYDCSEGVGSLIGYGDYMVDKDFGCNKWVNKDE